MSFPRGVALIAGLLATTSASAQVREIDRTKLPDPTAQHVYDDLLPIEDFARTYEATWRFPTPRTEVLDRLRSDLALLQSEQKSHPDNAELQLLTGLTAHLAYNLDVQEAYKPAVELLGSLAPKDYRAAWFLGIHRCQSLETVGGMKQLLAVEASMQKLPGDFWQDYANCASVTFMPAHAIRAYDLADEANGGPVDPPLEEIARRQIKPTSNTATYKDRQAWSEIEIGKMVRFTSTLCGISFSAPSGAAIQMGSTVEHGSCYTGVETPRYKTRTHPSSATMSLHSDPAPPGDTLASFAGSYMRKPDFAGATNTLGLPCPDKECIAYELISNSIYYLQGGAHVLLAFFASDQPQYPGLKLETPIALPKPDPKSSAGPTFYRPEETLQRLPGTRFFVAILDANADIYAPSRADFETFLRSIVLDSK